MAKILIRLTHAGGSKRMDVQIEAPATKTWKYITGDGCLNLPAGIVDDSTPGQLVLKTEPPQNEEAIILLDATLPLQKEEKGDAKVPQFALGCEEDGWRWKVQPQS